MNLILDPVNIPMKNEHLDILTFTTKFTDFNFKKKKVLSYHVYKSFNHTIHT